MALQDNGAESRPDGTPEPYTTTTAVVVTDERGVITGWSEEARSLLGYAPGEVVSRPAADLLVSHLPPSALRRVAEQEPWYGTVPALHRDGRTVDIAIRACPCPDRGGRPQWVLTASLPDVPSLPGDKGTLLGGLALSQLPIAVAFYDQDNRVVEANDVIARIVGLPEERIRGRRLTDFLPSPAYDEFAELQNQVVRTGEPVHVVRHLRAPGQSRGRFWSVFLSPLKNRLGQVQGSSVALLDITEQCLARQRLLLVNEAGNSIGSTLDVTRTAQELTDVVVPRLADYASVDLLEFIHRGEEPPDGPPRGPVTMRRTARQADTDALLGIMLRLGNTVAYPASAPTAECLATGRSAVYEVNDSSMARWMAQDPERATRLLRSGAHSVMVVPMRARGVTLGSVFLGRTRNPEAFAQDDVLLAEEITARAAVCIDNARRYTRERVTAMTLQRSLLPVTLPCHPAVEAASRYLPAGGRAGVGGDWFDVIPLSGARVALVVGDVVGHGIQASATMGRLRTAVRTLADIDLPPDELLTHLDDVVIRLSCEAAADADIAGDNGATCLYAVYDPVSRRCCLARAGHPPPVVVAPDGEAAFLDLPASPPLGLGGLPFEAREMELPEGSLLALYTNGLIEARGHDIDERLGALRRTLTRPAQTLDTLCDNVLATLLPVPPDDDIALLVARTHTLGADQVATWSLPSEPVVVAQARKQATDQLTAWGLDESAFVTELVVSELVTNAIRYGRPPIQLRLIHNGSLVCEVSDASSTSPHLRRARTFDEGGRGLLLVAQFAWHWGTRHTSQGKTIWAEIPLAA
ncbi:SpoIIE family protein phosphatase [Streptomyces sp. enrichment culture]|uniref:SpoIIE family protein phosphatase n=1 Tax=Streptomyces sp. enrichment culture TaxID=1795815 RepID=UPI003F5754CF